jgi:hypothetical protein
MRYPIPAKGVRTLVDYQFDRMDLEELKGLKATITNRSRFSSLIDCACSDMFEIKFAFFVLLTTRVMEN